MPAMRSLTLALTLALTLTITTTTTPTATQAQSKAPRVCRPCDPRAEGGGRKSQRHVRRAGRAPTLTPTPTRVENADAVFATQDAIPFMKFKRAGSHLYEFDLNVEGPLLDPSDAEYDEW